MIMTKYKSGDKNNIKPRKINIENPRKTRNIRTSKFKPLTIAICDSHWKRHTFLVYNNKHYENVKSDQKRTF